MLDLDPFAMPALPGERCVSTTHESRLLRAELYNRLAMQIMEWAGQYSSQAYYRFFPESWRRADDGATYAAHIGDCELYQDSIRWMEQLEAEYATLGYLFSPQGILMHEAVRLFCNAAELGDPEARWNLGWRYELGQGVSKDHDGALLLWTQAARLGHKAAREKLAELGRPLP